jgi:hypothetical protein
VVGGVGKQNKNASQKIGMANGRKIGGVTVSPEAVNLSEQEEVSISNSCLNGMDKTMYLLQHMPCV